MVYTVPFVIFCYFKDLITFKGSAALSIIRSAKKGQLGVETAVKSKMDGKAPRIIVDQ
jgi:hypothetical protein